MKIPCPLLFLSSALLLTSCDRQPEEPPERQESQVATDLKQVDIPILPLKEGDTWKYTVRVQIPEGVTSEGASEVDVEHEKTRIYLGKIRVGADYPEVDAFEVTLPGVPVERELVEIHDDRILMRGTIYPEKTDSPPLWYDTPIPFVVAGMRPGQGSVGLEAQDGARQRDIRVVAREQVSVPAGEFEAIRLLMTGKDGEFEIRRTTWFAPGIGIVKEEKTRYAQERLLFRETTDLIETSVTRE